MCIRDRLESSSTTNESDTATGAKDKFFQTLSNFTDPFVDPSEAKSDLSADDFHYSVTAWEGSLCRPIISDEREFDYRNLEDLEHVIEGVIDQNGLFHGTVKAFGKLLDGEILINPPYAVPARADSRIGAFHLRLGALEGKLGESTHPIEIQTKLLEQAQIYGGLLMFLSLIHI